MYVDMYAAAEREAVNAAERAERKHQLREKVKLLLSNSCIVKVFKHRLLYRTEQILLV